MPQWSANNAVTVKKPTYLRAGAKDGDLANTFATQRGWVFKHKDGGSWTGVGSAIGYEEELVTIGGLANSMTPAIPTSVEWSSPTLANGATGGLWVTYDVQLVANTIPGNANITLAVVNGINLTTIQAFYAGLSAGANRVLFNFTAPNNANVTTPLTTFQTSAGITANQATIVRNSLANVAAVLIANTSNTVTTLSLATQANVLASTANTLSIQILANLANSYIIARLFPTANGLANDSVNLSANLVTAGANNTNSASSLSSNTTIFISNLANTENSYANSVVLLALPANSAIIANGMTLTASIDATNANLTIGQPITATSNGAGALIITQ